MASTPGRLQGRVAIVTGGTRGIGREISLTFAAEGANLVVAYQGNSKAAAELEEEVRKGGKGKAVVLQADVSKSADVKALFDKAEQEFGQVHILVNNAGTISPHYPTLADTSDEEWDRVQAVNLRGSFLGTKEALNRIVTNGGGRVVNISSTLVGMLLPGYAAYSASKAAVEAFTKTAAKEARGKGITLNCVAPGPVATDLFFAGKTEAMVETLKQASPLGRLGQPKDIAAVVLFLVSDEGEWVNGQVIRANGAAFV